MCLDMFELLNFGTLVLLMGCEVNRTKIGLQATDLLTKMFESLPENFVTRSIKGNPQKPSKIFDSNRRLASVFVCSIR
jgi:hypothetical protein